MSKVTEDNHTPIDCANTRPFKSTSKTNCYFYRMGDFYGFFYLTMPNVPLNCLIFTLTSRGSFLAVNLFQWRALLSRCRELHCRLVRYGWIGWIAEQTGDPATAKYLLNEEKFRGAFRHAPVLLVDEGLSEKKRENLLLSLAHQSSPKDSMFFASLTSIWPARRFCLCWSRMSMKHLPANTAFIAMEILGLWRLPARDSVLKTWERCLRAWSLAFLIYESSYRPIDSAI